MCLSAPIDYIFRYVVMHRYDDVVPNIRAVCMAKLGTCLSRLPQQFLGDLHIKYIGWNSGAIRWPTSGSIAFKVCNPFWKTRTWSVRWKASSPIHG